MTDKIKAAYELYRDKMDKADKVPTPYAIFTAGANFGMEMDRWVRVEDGLPEKNEEYIVWNGICSFEAEWDSPYWRHIYLSEIFTGITHYQNKSSPPQI